MKKPLEEPSTSADTSKVGRILADECVYFHSKQKKDKDIRKTRCNADKKCTFLPIEWQLPKNVHPLIQGPCLRALRYVHEGSYPVPPPPRQGTDDVWSVILPSAESQRLGKLQNRDIDGKIPFEMQAKIHLTRNQDRALVTKHLSEEPPRNDMLVVFITKEKHRYITQRLGLRQEIKTRLAIRRETETKLVVESNYYPTRQCNHCDARAQRLKRCAGCRWAFYCNEMCQRANWPQHKHQCCPDFRLPWHKDYIKLRAHFTTLPAAVA